MTSPRARSLAALLRELYIEGGMHVVTSGPAEGSAGDSTTLCATTIIAPCGDVVVKVTPGVRADGPLWAEHSKAVRSRLEPLGALRSWMSSIETWTVRGTFVAALISVLAAILDEKGFWIERLVRIVIPSLLAFLVKRYSRVAVRALAGVFLRRLLTAELRTFPR
jgi:hypothetical protein